MSTFGGGVKVSAAVSATSSATGTLYTCPANSYAIINVSLTGGNQGITVGGVTALANQGASTGAFTIYAGPGQIVAATSSSSGTVSISGVQFTN